MKNELSYYYNINPTSIHQINKNYKCYVDNNQYLLMLCEEKENTLPELQVLSYYLFQNGIPCHQIIPNINNELITVINNNRYILLQIFVENRAITVDDIVSFGDLYIDGNHFRSLVKNDWYNMWMQKIDYFEYQISQFGRRYPLLEQSSSYYVGLAENSISFLSNNVLGIDDRLSVSHRRIGNSGLVELYNPLNFLLDSKVRDLAEYIKNNFFYGKYSISKAIDDIKKFNLNKGQYILLYSRLLFPSYYFDKFEEIVFENRDENELLKVISKNISYKIFLQEIYNIFIKNFNIQPIEWIIKT